MFRFGMTIAFALLLCALQLSGEKLNDPLSVARDAVTDVHLQNSPNNSSIQNSNTSPPKIVEHHSKMTSISDNSTTFLRLEDALRVFDIVGLAKKWHSIKNEFKPQCSIDMTDYFQGLKQHNIWATKSECSS